MIELDKAQKQSVYQLLQKRNLEGYQPKVELLMLNRLNPAEALNLVIQLCDKTVEVTKDTIRERLTGRRW